MSIPEPSRRELDDNALARQIARDEEAQRQKYAAQQIPASNSPEWWAWSARQPEKVKQVWRDYGVPFNDTPTTGPLRPRTQLKAQTVTEYGQSQEAVKQWLGHFVPPVKNLLVAFRHPTETDSVWQARCQERAANIAIYNSPSAPSEAELRDAWLKQNVRK